MQLLPGRLEVIAGMPTDSIRFIKQPGTNQSVTLGRTRGEPGSHIQIPSPTVSRMHVRMSFEGGRWTLENLSETNPVAINGRPATGRGARCVLSDGDRIEMGEVAFFYRQR
ncbi:MAG: FHA domain-containing protein [Gemmatimonadetes bacterium]|nr:FHA domain-containing protein [Gemmatimonadota bacterium]